MILTGPEIMRQRSLGRITIDPFDPERINPNSYNYHLGNEVLEYRDLKLDAAKRPRTIKHRIGKNGFVLLPGKLYLGYTKEVIGSDYYVTSLIGRSTIGRMGLWLQIVADLGHAGSRHRWTLELKVVQPLRVYAEMQIGQISFWKMTGEPVMYRGKYSKDFKAAPSKIHREIA